MTKPIVTIGVCVKNSAATLCETIESIIYQDFPHELIEVIFVDDGSEDATLSIINRYVPKMNMHAKVFTHKWRGLGPSRNVVVDNASGNYIIWVDGDTILPEDHVRKQVKFMEQNPTVGIGKANYWFAQGESTLAVLENIPFVVYDSTGGSLNSKLPGTGGAIFRVNALHQIGGFDNTLKGVGEDQDVAYRIKLAGWRIERTPTFFFEKRVQSWRNLWRKYFWYGYGDYSLYVKNRKIFSLHKMVPIAGFVAGMLLIAHAYRLVNFKSTLLLPFHFAFKMAAWCAGFTMSKIDFARSG